jgi:RNA polymerase sigma factor (sigma-70 family)
VKGEHDDLFPDRASDAWGGETDWNLIREVSGKGKAVDAEAAWLQLVERYRIPVRRLLRRLLRDDPTADDAADEFFSYLFQKQILPKADPEQGRFRCYIQGVMKRYARSWRRATSMPRVREDVDDVDVGADGESGDLEREEELVWADAVLDHALERLRREAPKDADLLVRFYGLGGVNPSRGDELAKDRGRNDNNVHVAVHRARARLRAALLAELAPMVSSKEELEQERQFLVTRLFSAHPGLDLEDDA